MTQARFTKGPWLIATSCSWRRIINERGDPVCVPFVQRSDNHPDLFFANGGDSGPDASLLKAAPLMYEALEALHHAVTSVRCRNLDECVLAAEAVLRTVRGETQERRK